MYMKSVKRVYNCEKCNYFSCKKSNWSRHIATQKHIGYVYKFNCGCGKIYHTQKGLYKHKQKCTYVLEVLELLKINDKMQEKFLQMLEDKDKQIANIYTGSKGTTNNITINVFLNEHCKDAMNIDDFTKDIEVSLTDLEYTNNKGYIEGMSKLLIDNLKEIDIKDRPIHCTDKKRLQFYVKSKDKWEKGRSGGEIGDTISKVAHKHIGAIRDWESENVGYENRNGGMDSYFKKTQNIHPASDQSVKNDENDKILKKIAASICIKGVLQN